MTSEATVRLDAKGERLVAVGEGNGPVNALDKALRAALEQIYPELAAPRAHRLQGPHPGRHARHRRGHPGADRVRRRHRRHLEHGRRGREHHRRVAGTPWRKPSPTACSAPAASPASPTDHADRRPPLPADPMDRRSPGPEPRHPDRQLLLRRAALPARNAVGHLAGLQAQAPLAPYVGLWTRLAASGHEELKDLLTERLVVRAHVHAQHGPPADRRRLRLPSGRCSSRSWSAPWPRTSARTSPASTWTSSRRDRHRLLRRDPADREPARRAAGSPLAGPRSQASLAYAATHLLHLVQVPAARDLGRGGAGRLVPGQLPGCGPSLVRGRARAGPAEQLVLRYLAPTARPRVTRHPGLVGPVPAARGDRPPGRAAAPVHRARRRRAPGPARRARGPTRTSRPRSGSCPSTTTCCCPSPTGAGSSRGSPPGAAAPRQRRDHRHPAGGAGSGRPTGRSPGAADRAVLEIRPFRVVRPVPLDAVGRRGQPPAGVRRRPRPRMTSALLRFRDTRIGSVTPIRSGS